MVSAETSVPQAAPSGERRDNGAVEVNVGDLERLLSVAGGGLIALQGLASRSLAGLALAALGGGLIYRGLTGHCQVYAALDTGSAHPRGPATAVPAGHGVKVTRSITIHRPAAELYRIWRNLEGLPRFMKHLVSVSSSGNRSHWVARAPVGMRVEWDAEIHNEDPGRLIAWRSLEGSQVDTAGSVEFRPTADGRGTEVRVTLKYDPPGGKLGAWIASLFGEEPDEQIADDLRRFEQLAESGEAAPAAGQPSVRAY